eukprot:2781367-Pyramimonas_sp.AAC.1
MHTYITPRRTAFTAPTNAAFLQAPTPSFVVSLQECGGGRSLFSFRAQWRRLASGSSANVASTCVDLALTSVDSQEPT